MHFGAKSTFARNAISLGRKEVKTDDVVATPPSLGCGLVELDRLRTQYCLKAGGSQMGERIDAQTKAGVHRQGSKRDFRPNTRTHGVLPSTRGMNRCSEGFSPLISKGNSGKNPIEQGIIRVFELSFKGNERFL